MDWHFRVHQRMTEAEKRGQHRSWFVDELVRPTPPPFHTSTEPYLTIMQDWIRTREAIDTDYTAHPPDPSSLSLDPSTSTSSTHNRTSSSATTAQGSKANTGASAATTKTPYLPVPEDSSRVNSTCPICQEKFEMKWLDEAQEWVWTDAVRVGGRVFHASCHAEAYGQTSQSQQQSQSQQGVLGKRKAEVCSST
jgi:pre-mRNA cleavage complex 2 protein Pcf11